MMKRNIGVGDTEVSSYDGAAPQEKRVRSGEPRKREETEEDEEDVIGCRTVIDLGGLFFRRGDYTHRHPGK